MRLKQTKNILLVLTIGALVLSACNMNSASPTPTQESIEAVYTAAAATLAVQLTSTAAAQPSATTTPTVTPTGTVTPTATKGTPAPSGGGVVAPPASGGGGAVGCNNAAYVSDVTVPDGTQMTPGQTFTKTWRIQNTGSCAWNTNFKVTFVSGDQMGGSATAITESVNAGASIDVSVNLTAPSTPKSYTGYWRMSTDGGQAFGMSFYVQISVGGTPGTAGPTATLGAVSGNDAAFVLDVTYPDGSNVNAGESFTKTWRIKNTGSKNWTFDYKFYFTGGELMGSDTVKIRRTVTPGSTTDISLTFTAPSAPGTYIGYWRMSTDTGTLFGAAFTVKIIVPGPTNTPVPPTGTPTVTPTTASYP